jgi:hypothetical protein
VKFQTFGKRPQQIQQQQEEIEVNQSPIQNADPSPVEQPEFAQEPEFPQQQPEFPQQEPEFPQQQPEVPQQEPEFPQQEPEFPQQEPAFPQQEMFPQQDTFPQQEPEQPFPQQEEQDEVPEPTQNQPEETPSNFQGFQESDAPPNLSEFPPSSDLDQMVPFADIPQEEANNGSPVNLDPTHTTDFPSFNSEEPSGEPEAPQEGRYAEETAYKRPGSRRRPANNQRFRPESRDRPEQRDRPAQNDKIQISDDPFFSRVNSEDTYGPFEFKKIFGGKSVKHIHN